MTAAILDTNILVSAAIGSPRAAAARALDAYYQGRYRLIFSPATIDELLEVLLLPHIRARHGWSDDEVLRFLTSLFVNADLYPDRHTVPASLTRDVTDPKFLALAVESGAPYLVTNDRRHLLRLGRYGPTRIVTPAHFLRELP
jgi:putative PIN family toxin of toxin-antitoxin system